MKPKQQSPRKKKSPKRPAAARRTATRKARLQMPAILFEGDGPTPPRLSGPGEKFALGDSSPAQEMEASELPEAYGTGRLFVITRDPHCLYVRWDFTREQQRRFNSLSAHGHLILRTYMGALHSQPVSDIHVHPESRHWFAHVERASTQYVAELGYYRRDHKWVRVATSAAALTPPDSPSSDTTALFATIPVGTPFKTLLARASQAAQEDVPLAPALVLEELRRAGHPELSAAAAAQASEWTPERERALAEVIRMDTSPCAWMDALEITGMFPGQPELPIFSPETSEFGLASWAAAVGENVSSPSGGPPEGAKAFWFNLDADVVIHGATEHDATVTIGGRRIALRPDGSFSVRFALPDGQHELVVGAVSADGTEVRTAELKFKRATEFGGKAEGKM